MNFRQLQTSQRYHVLLWATVLSGPPLGHLQHRLADKLPAERTRRVDRRKARPVLGQLRCHPGKLVPLRNNPAVSELDRTAIHGIGKAGVLETCRAHQVAAFKGITLVELHAVRSRALPAAFEEPEMIEIIRGEHDCLRCGGRTRLE